MAGPFWRTVAAVAAAALLWSVGSVAAVPVAGAGTQRGAVSEFIAAYEAGDVGRATAAVCGARQDAVAGALDVAAQMGLGDARELLDALRIRIRDVDIEVTSSDGHEAIAAVTATLVMRYPQGRIDALVTSMLQADLAPGEAVSAEDVEFARPYIASMLNGTLPIEEEVPLLREDGEWLVCGGFGLEGPAAAGVPVAVTVSTSGLCGLVTPAELTAPGGLAYDSSNGFETFCNYATSDFDAYHAAAVSLELDDDATSAAGYFEAARTLQVAGAPAFATGPSASQNVLFVQVGPDVLQVTLSPPDPAPEGFDWLTQAVAVAERFVPLVPGFREQLEGPPEEGLPDPALAPSLCDLLPLRDLNAATGLGFDEASGDAYYCGYIQVDGNPGWHSLTMSLAEMGLDELRAWMPGAEDAAVAGRPALRDEVQLIVALPGDAWALQLFAWIDESDPSPGVTLESLLDMVAAVVVPLVQVPEPTRTDGPGPGAVDDGPGADAADDPASLLGRPLCDYVDLDAVNALGPLAFDEVADLYPGLCSITQTDVATGWSTVVISVDGGDLDDVAAFFPGAASVDVEGYPGILVDAELFVASPLGILALSAVLPDWAVADGMAPADILLPLAGLVVGAMEADAIG